ncbi:hypothetical protein [Spongiactinospora sp. TRM90649]|uniref:hypothetical protein n=1 Tax=Spongiactinospora sp. TRM90649 TaxID=3031114 RepID=UPI0023F9A8D8|nr:hypothetical protein [Spongiactinospora sp. TRM90649]MDF5756603.1 hypothetical protein [Spongiactinospora sp. TRM90649]
MSVKLPMGPMQPWQQATAAGLITAFFVLALTLPSGIWAFLAAMLALFIGIALGYVGGSEAVRHEASKRYDRLYGLFNEAMEQRDAYARKAYDLTDKLERAEADLLATAAEKTRLNRRLEQLTQGPGAQP